MSSPKGMSNFVRESLRPSSQ